MCDIILFAIVTFYCPGMVESLHQHVNENFQKQTPSIQEMLRIRLLRLRVALCSIIPSGRQRAAECRALLTFFSISYVLRTIVRPKSAMAQEKVSCDQVSNISMITAPSYYRQVIVWSFIGALNIEEGKNLQQFCFALAFMGDFMPLTK